MSAKGHRFFGQKSEWGSKSLQGASGIGLNSVQSNFTYSLGNRFKITASWQNTDVNYTDCILKNNLL